MIRHATFVSDLVDYPSVSRDRLDEAIRSACPSIAAWCDAADARLNCRQLADFLAERLHACHCVGLAELMKAELRRQFVVDFARGIPDRLSLETASSVDLLVTGAVARTLRQKTHVELMPLDPWLKDCANHMESGTWRYKVALAIQDIGMIAWTDFHEQEGEALLPGWADSTDVR